MDPLIILLSSVMVTLELGKLSSGTKNVLVNSYTLLTSGIFSSLVIDNLCFQPSENFCVLHLYCDYDTHKERSATDLIAELLKKAVFGQNGTPEEVSREFKKSKKCGARERPPLQNVVNMLGGVLASFERAFICIDALDEFPQEQRSRFLDSLAGLILMSPKTRLFLTGRPQIQHDKYFDGGAQTISITAREGEIEAYIAHKLDQSQNSADMNNELKAEIMKILPHKVSGMYVGTVISYAGDVSFADNHV